MKDILISEPGKTVLSLQSYDDRYFYVEIRAISPGVNRNNWDFTLEGLKKNGKTFAGTPLLTAYVNGKIGDGHNFKRTRNRKTGEYEADFRGADAERIVGEIPQDANIRVEQQDGKDWLILPARIWRYYAQQLVGYIAENKAMDVSVEVNVDDGYEVRDDGVEVFTDWTALGVTILGQGVTPAIEGARLRALAASEEYKEMRLKAASYVPKKQPTKTGGSKMNEALKKMLSEAMKDHGQILGYSADGKYASVLRTNGLPALYPLADFNEGDGVIVSQFIDAALMLSANVEGEDGESIAVSCEASSIIASLSADVEAARQECENAKTECENAKTECATAQARVKELEEADKQRVLAEMTAAVDEAVAKHNARANAAEQISAEELNVIHNAINNGEYATTDEAKNAFKVLAYDKEEAQKKKTQKSFAWNNLESGESLTGTDALIAHFAAAGEN